MDNRTDPAQAASAARMLDTQHKVLVFSGPTSSDTALAVYGYAEQNKVPFVVPVAAFPRLTRPGTEWTFRVEPDAVGWGYAIVKFVEKMKPGASIALIYSDFALQRAIVAGIKYQAERSGVKIATDIIFPQNATDATVQAAQVKSKNPDFVFVSGGGAFDVTITNQILDLGIKPEQIIHPFGAVKMILGWGPRSVGSYYGTFFDHSLGGLNDYGQGADHQVHQAEAATSPPTSRTSAMRPCTSSKKPWRRRARRTGQNSGTPCARSTPRKSPPGFRWSLTRTGPARSSCTSCR